MNRIRIFALVVLATLTSPAIAAEQFGIDYEKHPVEGLIVGGQPSENQLVALADAGFTTVINLRRAGEFDEFDESAAVQGLGMRYVHIPVRNVASIRPEDAERLHEAIGDSEGPVLLHCTVGWRAGALLAIERYLLHEFTEKDALEVAADAHMAHATGDVSKWIRSNGR